MTRRLKIGDVSELLNIPSYVLRYWETEFPELKPEKSRSGQRLYSNEDIAFIEKIARLRYVEKLTISGCKERLKQEKHSQSNAEQGTGYPSDIGDKINSIKKGLQKILEQLR
ncbi:MAG: MerR family transcriptional regulator [bacterium]